MALSIRKAATMPTSLTAPTPIGGAISGAVILGNTIGEVHFTMAALGTGGGTRIQYSKFGAYNDGPGNASDVKIWIENACDQLGADAAPKGVSTSTSDDSTKKIRWMGYETITGNALQVEQTLNGTTEITCPSIFQALHRVEIRLVSGGALTTLVGDFTIKQGITTLGIIPAGFGMATWEYAIGMALTLDDTGTTTNAGTAPTSIVFTSPRTEAGALSAVATPLAANSYQGIWSRWSLPERAKPSADITYLLRTSIVVDSV